MANDKDILCFDCIFRRIYYSYVINLSYTHTKKASYLATIGYVFIFRKNYQPSLNTRNSSFVVKFYKAKSQNL